MKNRRFADFNLSPLMLGTVQFGIPYGIANRSGQPDYGNVLQILESALAGGVNCFDTAAAYGTSEAVLGQALHELGVAERVVVVTKVASLAPEQRTNQALAARAIEQSVDASRKRLRLDTLPIVLFHREADAIHMPVLLELKSRGWLLHAGISCDNRPGPARCLASAKGVTALQIPANILDRRHRRSGAFTEAAQKGVAVFVRSVYLQGLLLMPEEAIPAPLKAVVPVRRKLDAIAAREGITMAELAIRYVLAQQGVTCVLAGVETVAQVRENIAIVQRGPLSSDLTQEIDTVVPDLPESILTPSMW